LVHIKYIIFSILIFVMFIMYFLVSFDILFNALNPQYLSAPYCSKKNKTTANLAPWSFKCPFQHPCYYLLSFYHSLSTLSSFYCSPSFIIFGVVHMCFCWSPSLGHS
jgi:hypothetical protein